MGQTASGNAQGLRARNRSTMPASAPIDASTLNSNMPRKDHEPVSMKSATGFARSLRRAGLDAPPSATIDFAEALAVARKAGALLHEGKGSGQDFVFDVSGHEGDHNFAIWIRNA